MTLQSTWIPKDPPLKIGETVVVTPEYSKVKGKTGKIVDIKGPFDSPWMRTDRWMSDWFVLEFEDKTVPWQECGFLEDEIERVITNQG